MGEGVSNRIIVNIEYTPGTSFTIIRNPFFKGTSEWKGSLFQTHSSGEKIIT